MIKLDGKYSFEDFGLIPEEGHEHPSTPNIENKTINIPGMTGLWDFGPEVKERPFSFPLACIEMDRTELQRRLNAFVAFLFDQYGKPREFTMEFGYDPGKFYKVKCVNRISAARIMAVGQFELTLVAFDSVKYAKARINEIHWDSEVVSFDDDYSFDTVFIDEIQITKNQTLEAYVNGFAIRPDILISGSGNNVTFSVNGKSFTLKNFDNAEIEIKGKNYTLFKNGADSLTEMTGDFLELLPGINHIQVSGGNMNFKLSIIHRDQYI